MVDVEPDAASKKTEAARASRVIQCISWFESKELVGKTFYAWDPVFRWCPQFSGKPLAGCKWDSRNAIGRGLPAVHSNVDVFPLSRLALKPGALHSKSSREGSGLENGD
jgi:hypothetical protein